MSVDPEDRLFSRLTPADPPASQDRLGRPIQGPCFLWSGVKDAGGYGVIRWLGKQRKVHRVTYEMARGEIRNQLDHLCRVRHCAAPLHLEDVTPRENTRRGNRANAAKTHCPSGHQYDTINAAILKDGSRKCRACDAARHRLIRGTPLDAKFGRHRTHCLHGHEWTPENTYWPPRKPGNRICRQCTRDSGRRYAAKRRQSALT